MAEILSKGIFSELKLENFVALDIETTGLKYENADIIEFAAIRFQNGEAADSLSFLLKPGGSIPRKITQITGITDSEVADAPSFSEKLPEIREFLGNAPLVAHNVGFDLPFLEYHARKSKNNFNGWNAREKQFHYFPNPQLDTLILARMYLPFLPAFNLASLADYYQIQSETAHRALPDARKAGLLFLELLQIALKTKFADVQKILQILEPTDEPVKTFFQNLALFLASGKYTVPEGIDRRQFSMRANQYNIIGEQDRPMFAKTESKPIDVDAVGDFFEANGELAEAFGNYEMRPQQASMAKGIARAFNDSTFLVVEAGTGTGKSMAYLLPAIKWALQNYGPQGRVVISTNTKNLQEQLFFKDLPVLHSILKDKFKAVLLKGKGNYLCLDKWVTVMNDMQFRLSPGERAKLLPLYFWVNETETGDIAENNSFRVERNTALWNKLIAENNYCPGKSCKFYDRCFLMKARNNARDAHLVLVNHSLLFSDLAADNAVLADYKNVILDEAHNIEKTATDYLGVETKLWQFRDFLNKLYTKDRRETGVLVQLKRRIQQGKLSQSQLEALLRIADEMMEEIPSGWRLVQSFFADLTRLLRTHTPAKKSEYTSKFRYKRDQRLFETLLPQFEEIKTVFNRLQSRLSNLIDYFAELKENSFEYQEQLYRELKSLYSQGFALVDNLAFLLTGEHDDHVYWYELPKRDDSDDTRLYAAPLDIGSILYERLYSKLRTAVFTSATLAVNRSFDYFVKRSGLMLVDKERVETLLLDSPFNYSEQVFLGIPSYFPEPNHPQYAELLKKLIAQLPNKLAKGTLTLFTSYYALNSVYNSVRDIFQAEKITLLGQGIDGGRHAIINRFKTEENSFLFGTDSFWEGVDVPGKALEVLLITKLPFDVPSDPVFEAKSELIARQGGNAFMDYAIPEAVIRLRQGFGRLIRARSDYGAVLILDTRVIKKFYGRIFLQSLPLEARVLAEEDELMGNLKKWFGL